MSYTYYSIMRPVGIGTYPGKPESIHNYEGGRKEVSTADGAVIMAWGELTYGDPLTDEQMRQYELRGEYEYAPFRKIGKWMDSDIDIIKIGKRYFALNGWNGSDYGHCWECKNAKQVMDDSEYTLTPVYFYDTNAGIALMNSMSGMDEDSPEWDDLTEKLNQIISYRVDLNR